MIRFSVAVLFLAASLAASASRIGDKALEYFELRNAIASEILSGDEIAVEKAIRKASACRMEATFSIVRCDVCKGKKPFVVTEPDHGQNSGRIKKSEMLGQHKVTCPVCGGKGSVRTFVPDDVLENAFAAAMTTFEAKQLAEGLTKTNGAFLTRAQLDKATPQQMQALAVAMGVPCRKCKASGIAECRKCKGEGTVKCRNPGCKDGWLKTQRKNTSKTKYPPVFKPCPKCGSTEKTVCAECSGLRGRRCKDCSGEGTVQKKR